MATRRNPQAGVAPATPTAGAPTPDELPGTVCSAPTDEPLAGTAKRASIIVGLEHYRGWGEDILDGEALGPELSTQLAHHLKAHRAELHLIRRPGRAGQQREFLRSSLAVFIARPLEHPPTLERLDLPSPEALLGLDLSAPGPLPGARRVHTPVIFVCTHGKRDRCCAIYGRPIAAHLAQQFPEDAVWEASHTKGHRFAPSMLLLPANYSFGRLDPQGAGRALGTAQRGELPLEGNRGRGIYDPASQVAELAVAAELAAGGATVGLGQLRVLATDVEDADRRAVPEAPGLVARRVDDPTSGRAWRVLLTRDVTTTVVSSCGDKPGTTASWRVRRCAETTPA